MNYFVSTPWWLRKLYPRRLWNVQTDEKIVYLTFDDGPHPEATTFVLDQLHAFNAKATFFCIGKNVQAEPSLYARIIRDGHHTGNHTQHHLNGWKTSAEQYLADVSDACSTIHSHLFRPPYGRIRSSQARKLPHAMKTNQAKIVMWSVLSGDFDESLSKEQCLLNVMNNIKSGSIVVFHDSAKAFAKLKYVLPEVLKNLAEKGYNFGAL